MSTKVMELVAQSHQVGDTSVWKEELCKDVEDKIIEIKNSRFTKCKKKRSSYIYYCVCIAVTLLILVVSLFIHSCASDRSCIYEFNSNTVLFFLCDLLSGVDMDH